MTLETVMSKSRNFAVRASFPPNLSSAGADMTPYLSHLSLRSWLRSSTR